MKSDDTIQIRDLKSGDKPFIINDMGKIAIHVLRRAILDTRSSNTEIKSRALHFLLEDQIDFPFWCRNLGINPSLTRSIISRKLPNINTFDGWNL